MKSMKFILFTILTMLSSLVSAHMGHGDHTAIVTSGQSHPVIGNEHMLAAMLAIATFLMAIKWLRK